MHLFKTIFKSSIILFGIFLFLSTSCSKDDSGPGDPLDAYVPGDASDILTDIQIFTTSASASEHQPGEDISRALDGDYTTLFHSLWNQSVFPEVPVVIDFVFSPAVDKIDYLLYHPRKDGGVNGFILETEVWVQGQGEGDFSRLADVVFADNSTTKRILFTGGLESPHKIRLVATRGRNDFISASQFEFFAFNDQAGDYAAYFTDLSFSTLREGVSRTELQGIANEFIRNMALAIYDGVYEEERVGLYSSYPDPAIISAENKTNRMGPYDNITGIYAEAGQELVVFVDETKADLVLRIVDHNQGYNGQDHFLHPGPNRITASETGLVYLIYHTDIEHTAKVNIASGIINGYFELGVHDNDDWEKLIANAGYDFFDLKGEKSLITFTTHELRQYTSDAVRLVEVYDSIVLMQQELMGLYKYDRVPAGRLYYRTNVSPGVYMHATQDATEYAPSTLQYIARHELLRGDHIWGPAHETGHIHQTRPGLMWIGMTEVTVNIYSQHVQVSFGNASRLQNEYVPGYANRYHKAFEEIIAAGIPHIAHEDVFCQLVPFWQLQLYFAHAQSYTDFYKDVHEQIRLNPDPPTDGECQLEFVRIVCDVAQTDMTEFFQAWGFLTPVDMDIHEYGVTRNMKITQEQIDELIGYIAAKGYPAPSQPVQYITDNTVGDYVN